MSHGEYRRTSRCYYGTIIRGRRPRNWLTILGAWFLGRYGAESQALLGSLALLGMTLFGVLFSIYLTYGELDYLLVDLPPGTADASLTTMQSLPVSGIVMVTTPQGLSAMIVRKAVHMAHHVGIPILGVVENMAYFVCPDTRKQHEVFGPSHADQVSVLAGAPILARLPINPQTALLCDAGKVETVDLPEVQEMLQAFLEATPECIPQKS